MTTGEVDVSVFVLVTDRSTAVTGKGICSVSLCVVTLLITDSGEASLSVDTRVIGLSELDPGDGLCSEGARESVVTLRIIASG
jgi:hypothetical protein